MKAVDRSKEGMAIALAGAIKEMADEHGLPNSFALSEIAGITRQRAARPWYALTPMQIGNLCRSHFTRPLIVNQFAQRGLRYERIEKREKATYIVVEKESK